MGRQKEQEIREYLDKIGLNYSEIIYRDYEYYIESVFKVRTAIKGDFKQNLIDGLKDIIQLSDSCIQNTNEN